MRSGIYSRKPSSFRELIMKFEKKFAYNKIIASHENLERPCKRAGREAFKGSIRRSMIEML
jgi:hypothetical protein